MEWEIERLGFAYGILLVTHYKRINEWIHKKWVLKSVVLMLASGILGVAYLKFKPVEFYGDYLLKILLGIVLTAFVIEITSRFRVGNKVNGLLGSISYEVYLLHEIVFAVVMLVMPRIDSGAFIVGSIVITVFVGYGLKKLSEVLMHIPLKK